MVQMKSNEKFRVSVETVPPEGVIDGPPTYPVDTPGIVTITVTPDGMIADIAGLALGTCTVTPTALAGGNTITGPPVQITVTAPPVFATALTVTIGAVVPQ